MKKHINTIRIITDLSIVKLASGTAADRNKFNDFLDAEGESGWQPYHIEDSAKGLMVFLTQEVGDE